MNIHVNSKKCTALSDQHLLTSTSTVVTTLAFPLHNNLCYIYLLLNFCASTSIQFVQTEALEINLFNCLAIACLQKRTMFLTYNYYLHACSHIHVYFPPQSLGRLLVAVGVFVYLLLAVPYFEEPGLVQEFGNSYRGYMKKTPMFFPIPFFKPRKEE